MAASFVVSAVLSRLRESLTGEIIGFLGVMEPVKNLLSNLEYIQTYMVDADRRLDKDEEIRRLLAVMRDICFDVEDVLDDFAVKRASRRRRRRRSAGFKRYIGISFEAVAQQLKVGAEIATLIGRINDLTQTLQMYDLKPATENENLMEAYRRLQLSEITHLINIEEIVGMEYDLFRFGSRLINEERERPVIAMCGMGGSGKTTLAKLLYNHNQIRGYFEGFAWVTVSETYRTKSVVEDTLVQLMPELRKEISHFEDITVAEKLSEVLPSKKCLVVLDDVWSSQVWETLRFAFAYQKTDSKVLVTTRIHDLAHQMAGGDSNVYPMRPLSTDDSWNLFTRKAFASGRPDIEDYQKIETMGMDMVTKCGGLPLAVVALGNLLATKSLSEWEMVHANIDSYLDTDLGSRGFSVIMEILSMSYSDLPYYVKPCFSYLGTFPENSEIEAEKLYLLWAAEDTIPLGQGEETVIEIGSRYLDALASRRMVHVEVDEVPTMRRFKFCNLRNLTREFCLTMGREVDFFEVMDLRHSNILSQNFFSSSSTCNTRRLAVYLDKYEDGYPIHLKQEISRVMETAYHLRSLLFHNAYHHEQYVLWPEEILNFEELRFLRVLSFDGYSFQTRTLPKGIETLVHLRFLSLRGCYLKELQSEIGDLLKLQTLDLRVTTSCKMTIPNILCKLKRLRHLYLPVAFQAKGDDKLHFAGLRDLQILKNFDTRVCHAQHLLGLTNIRVLDATTSGSNEDLKAIIELIKSTPIRQSTLDVRNFDCYSSKRKDIVTELFSCNGIQTLHIDGHIGKLPQINSSGLTKLSFSGSEFLQDPMATLAELPNLWVLVLRDDAYVGKVMVCPESGFLELRQLELSGLHKLQRLTIEKGAMPKLTTLSIEKCKSLEVPLGGLSFLDRLQELKIARMPM